MEATVMETMRKAVGLMVAGVLLAGGAAVLASEQHPGVVPTPVVEHDRNQASDPMIVEHDRNQAFDPMIVEHDNNQA
jgi:hypothetical protein